MPQKHECCGFDLHRLYQGPKVPNKRTLLLNADSTSLHVISDRRAYGLMSTGKAFEVPSDTYLLRSATQAFEISKVLQLKRYINVPRRRSMQLTNRAVLARDRRQCAYQHCNPKCQGKATTVDHVIPTSKGGKHIWENVVAACYKCNHKKGDKSLQDMGWSLRTTPGRPSGASTHILLHGYEECWEAYL